MTKIGIDKSTFIFLYNKNKDYIIPIVIILVSFFLLMEVTIPQLNGLSAREQEVKFEKDKLTVLKDNFKALSSVSEATLDLELSTASDTLPSSKNFDGILNAISVSANKSGVFLGDYEFQVGDLENNSIPSKGFPSLQLSLSIVGNAQGTSRFIDQIYRTAPISEISSIEVSNNRATLNTLFYYKPFAQKIFDESLPLPSLTKVDNATLKEISSWDNPSILQQIQPVLNPSSTSTSSAF